MRKHLTPVPHQNARAPGGALAMATSKSTSTDRAWMIALEMQFSTLAAVRKLSLRKDIPKSITDDHVLEFMHRSVPFAWTADTVDAVWQASASIPDDAEFGHDMLPDGIRSAFWWLEKTIPVPMKNPGRWQGDEGKDIDTANICAILMTLSSNGEWVLSCGRMTTIGIPFLIEQNRLRDHCSLGELKDPETRSLDAITFKRAPVRGRDLALFKFVLAASVWMKQRIAVVSSGHIERHRRKQLAREFDSPTISDVKIVELRRAESTSGIQAESSGEPVEWSCRWIVGGHWRNQPYANGERKLIYILPYVKGPDDKPLKVPSHTVYSVNR